MNRRELTSALLLGASLTLFTACTAATGDGGALGSGGGKASIFGGGGYGNTVDLQEWSLMSRPFRSRDPNEQSTLVVREEGRYLVIAVAEYDKDSERPGAEHGFRIPRFDRNIVLGLDERELFKEPGAPEDLVYAGDDGGSGTIAGEWARVCANALEDLNVADNDLNLNHLDGVRRCHAMARAVRMEVDTLSEGARERYREQGFSAIQDDEFIECDADGNEMTGYLDPATRELMLVGDNRNGEWVAHFVASSVTQSDSDSYALSVLPGENWLEETWDKTFGGSQEEEAGAGSQTADTDPELEALGANAHFSGGGKAYISSMVLDEGNGTLKVQVPENDNGWLYHCRITQRGLLEDAIDLDADSTYNGPNGDIDTAEEADLEDIWNRELDSDDVADESNDTSDEVDCDKWLNQVLHPIQCGGQDNCTAQKENDGLCER